MHIAYCIQIQEAQNLVAIKRTKFLSEATDIYKNFIAENSVNWGKHYFESHTQNLCVEYTVVSHSHMRVLQ